METLELLSRTLMDHQEATAAAFMLLALWLLSGRPLFKGVVVLASIALSLRYIVWRGAFTLNTVDAAGLAVSLSLLLAEAYGIGQYFLFIYQTWRIAPRKLPAVPDDELATVDVYITVYNEPLDILKRTVAGCQAMDYPEGRAKVYVLDDGRNDEVRRLCSRLGCGYITRDDNRGAKAGNINNALAKTAGELIAIFDCDHVPARGFLRETAPYMTDPKVAFLQTPHHFYNSDVFQHNLRLEKDLVNEQDLFFKIIQPGRDNYNSAFFAGSAGLFRRKALEEIGGLKTETVTEDLHTSMELHSRGWASVYVSKPLSAGLSPENTRAYTTQRKRWAEGAFQLFMLDNPLTKKGLTLKQRLSYFASILYFFHWLPRLVFMTAPLAYLLFDCSPIDTTLGVLLFFFIPHYVAQIFTFKTITRGHRNPFWNDVYETFLCFSLASTTFRTFFRPKGRLFEVTPKGLSSSGTLLSLSVVMPHIILLGLLVAGAGTGLLKIATGAAASGALAVSLAWTTYNIIVVVASVLTGVEKPQLRRHIRVRRRIPCEIGFHGGTVPCIATDISEGGIGVRLDQDLPGSPGPVSLRFSAGACDGSVIKAEVLRTRSEKEGGISAGLRFLDIDDDAYRQIVAHMFGPDTSWTGENGTAPMAKTVRSFFLLATLAIKSFMREKVLKRISQRYTMSYPCTVRFDGMELRGATRNVSASGLCAEVAGAIDLPRTIEMTVTGADGVEVTLSGRTVWQIKRGGRRITLGMAFNDPQAGSGLLAPGGLAEAA